MKRFIDELFVRNYDLAYKIAGCLEKDGEYSTVIFDADVNPRTHIDQQGFYIKIFREDKLACRSTIGYGTLCRDTDEDADRSLDEPVADC